jgi:hypothetical protein
MYEADAAGKENLQTRKVFIFIYKEMEATNDTPCAVPCIESFRTDKTPRESIAKSFAVYVECNATPSFEDERHY